MSRRGGGGGGRKFNPKHKGNKPGVGERAKQHLEGIDDDNPVIKMFRGYASELDDKHDRHERLVKLSRDVTIESKRIIFLLHSTNTDLESKRTQIMEEAHTRLQQLINTNFRAVARELDGLDPYLYHRAYTAGVQEFIEALVFYQYLKQEAVRPFRELEQAFRYQSQEDDGEGEGGGREMQLVVPHYDFLLGIGDFTGEMMRRCINNLGIGNIDDCFKLTNFVRDVYTGFLGVISPGCKEMGRKVYTLRQSLTKMELVCYNIQIRGSEIPKHMLASVIESTEMSPDQDEGFFC